MTNWKEYKVEEICSKVTSGGTPNTRKDEYYGGSIPWVRTQEVNFNRLYDAEIKITEEGLNNSSAKWIPANSIIIAMYGATAGKVAINKIPVTTNQACCNLIINKEKADYRFIYYNILSRFSSIASMAVGGAQQNLNAGMIKDLVINLPNLPTQTAIAEILSSLDDKIELNNKINQELENLAQTLFKQWFIDFEFPANLANPALSGDEGYKSSGGEMVDSELGEIPENFTLSILSEQTELVRGISYRKPELVSKEEGLPFVNLKCFALNGTFRQDGLKYFNGKYKEKHIIKPNDILVAVTDLTQDRVIIGLPILWNEKEIALPSLDVCIVRNENSALKHFLYYEFKTFRYKSRIIEFANGSTVLHLSVKGLETYEYALPNEDVLIKWNEVISPILDQINNNIRENQELTNLRDMLLPKLISGELEVAEVMTEKA
jgi:type I restriction enzyme, S subunit